MALWTSRRRHRSKFRYSPVRLRGISPQGLLQGKTLNQRHLDIASVLYIPRQPTVPHLAHWRRSTSKMAESNRNIFCSLHPALIRILQYSCQSFYIINRINISISKFAHIVPPPRQIQIKGHVTNSHNIRNQNMNGMDSTTNTILPRYTANSTQ